MHILVLQNKNIEKHRPKEEIQLVFILQQFIFSFFIAAFLTQFVSLYSLNVCTQINNTIPSSSQCDENESNS